MESNVLSCKVNGCGYNMNEECRAQAVSIGADHAMCDTFSESGTAEAEASPLVAACQIDDCQFNESQGCHASGINVAWHEHHADCGTFLPR